MDGFGAKSLTICLAALVSSAFLAGCAFADEAPAPAPTSAAGVISPQLAVAVFASSVALILGSLRQ